MASLNDCTYAMYVVMIIARNNVHLFQLQSDKLYLCCTFGLLAWTLLSNISQLGLLLTHKPSKLLSNYQCFLDVVLFQSTTKGHFFALRSSTLLLSSSCPSSCWPKRTKDFKLHFLCALCEHCKSKALRGLVQGVAFHHPAGEDAPQTPAKHTGNLTTTYSSSRSFQGAWLTTLEYRFIKVALIADISILHSHDSFPVIPELLCFLWTAGSRNINATSVFQRKKKGTDTYLYLNYIYACTHTHINPFAVNKKAGLSEGVINALQSSFSLGCIISPMNLPLVNIPNLCQ